MRLTYATIWFFLLPSICLAQKPITQEESDAAYAKMNARRAAAATQPTQDTPSLPQAKPKFVGNGKWKFSYLSDKGKPILSFSLEAEDDRVNKTEHSGPVLRIDLWERGYVEANLFTDRMLKYSKPIKRDGNGATSVALAFDDYESQPFECQVRGDRFIVLGFVDDPSDVVLGGITASDKLVAKYILYNEENATAIFDLRGINNIIEETLRNLRRDAVQAKKRAEAEEVAEKNAPHPITMDDFRRLAQRKRR